MAGKRFNAFEYYMELKKVGVPEAQAELQARAMDQLQDYLCGRKREGGFTGPGFTSRTEPDLKRDIES